MKPITNDGSVDFHGSLFAHLSANSLCYHVLDRDFDFGYCDVDGGLDATSSPSLSAHRDVYPPLLAFLSRIPCHLTSQLQHHLRFPIQGRSNLQWDLRQLRQPMHLFCGSVSEVALIFPGLCYYRSHPDDDRDACCASAVGFPDPKSNHFPGKAEMGTNWRVVASEE